MTATIHILLWALACIVSAPLLVLSVQCMLGLFPARRRFDDSAPAPKVAVLVPAHNEQSVIIVTLDSLKRALPESGRIIVVADNCTDNTAAVCKAHGAAVVERHDEVNRGKGYALATGLASLEDDAPDVVVIVDADCTVSPNTLTDLARTAQSTGRPAQGVYLLNVPDTRDPKSVVSAFAFLVKNQARPRGMDLLGLPVPLTGSGMAFPYALLKDADLASGNIVEDLALGLDLTRKGHGPVLCDPARITGSLPGAADAAVTQRTRWEHGYLSTLLTRTPGLLLTGVFRFKPSLIASAVDLAVPPLSLLVSGALAALALTAGLGWLIKAAGPGCLIGTALALTAVTLGLTWARFGRKTLPLRAVAAIPGYILWKWPIYIRFVLGREKSWVRTGRDSGPNQPTGTSDR